MPAFQTRKSTKKIPQLKMIISPAKEGSQINNYTSANKDKQDIQNQCNFEENVQSSPKNDKIVIDNKLPSIFPIPDIKIIPPTPLNYKTFYFSKIILDSNEKKSLKQIFYDNKYGNQSLQKKINLKSFKLNLNPSSKKTQIKLKPIQKSTIPLKRQLIKDKLINSKIPSQALQLVLKFPNQNKALSLFQNSPKSLNVGKQNNLKNEKYLNKNNELREAISIPEGEVYNSEICTSKSKKLKNLHLETTNKESNDRDKECSSVSISPVFSLSNGLQSSKNDKTHVSKEEINSSNLINNSTFNHSYNIKNKGIMMHLESPLNQTNKEAINFSNINSEDYSSSNSQLGDYKTSHTINHKLMICTSNPNLKLKLADTGIESKVKENQIANGSKDNLEELISNRKRVETPLNFKTWYNIYNNIQKISKKRKTLHENELIDSTSIKRFPKTKEEYIFYYKYLKWTKTKKICKKHRDYKKFNELISI